MKLLFAVILIFFLDHAFSQVADDDKKLTDNLELHCYGEISYNRFDWQTYPGKRDNIDMNQVVFEPEYHFSDKVKLEMEIEFEHGGTGTTMEFDKFEEFGEFEVEVEKGGEVMIEELELSYSPKSWLELKVGRIGVPVGFLSHRDEPLEYLTTSYNNTEFTLIPSSWYEFGVGAKISFKKFTGEIAFVNALDNSAFSSANWIQRGNQKRFETVNAEAFALAVRIDYAISENSVVGVSAYAGNSTPNRPKPDTEVDGYVNIIDGHLHLEPGNFIFNGLLLYGTLQNADLISDANRNLSNNLNVKRTPVGSAALGYFFEAGYDLFSFTKIKNATLILFSGYYYYDSMNETSGEVFNNPRWERSEIRTGINYTWNDHIALKSDFTARTIGIPDLNNEKTFSTAIAFYF